MRKRQNKRMLYTAVINEWSLPSPNPSNRVTFYTDDEIEDDLSGIDKEWLVKYAFAETKITTLRPTLYHINLYAFQGPFNHRSFDELLVKYKAINNMKMGNILSIQLPIASIIDESNRYYFAFYSVYTEIKISYGIYKYQNISYKKIFSKEDILPIQRFLPKFREKKEKPEAYIKFRKEYSFSLLYSCCLLFILEVGDLGLDTILMDKDTGQCAITTINVKRKISVESIKISNNQYFYFSNPIPWDKWKNTWLGMVSHVYKQVADTINSIKIASVVAVGDIARMKELQYTCVTMLYRFIEEEQNEKLDIVEAILGKTELVESEIRSKRPKRTYLPVPIYEYGIKGELITKEPVLNIRKEAKRPRGGMKHSVIKDKVYYTYSYDNDRIYSEDFRRKYFRVGSLKDILRRCIDGGITYIDIAHKAAVELFRMHEIKVYQGPLILLRTLLISALEDISFADIDLVQTVISYCTIYQRRVQKANLNSKKGVDVDLEKDISITTILSLVTYMSESNKVTSEVNCTELWHETEKEENKKYTYRGIEQEYRGLIKNEDAYDLIIEGRKYFQEDDPEIYKQLGSMFYTYLKGGEDYQYQAYLYLRYYYIESTATEHEKMYRGTKQPYAPFKVMLRIISSVTGMDLQILEESYTVFGIPDIAAYCVCCYFYGVDLRDVEKIKIERRVEEEEVERYMSGEYDFEIGDIIDEGRNPTGS